MHIGIGFRHIDPNKIEADYSRHLFKLESLQFSGFRARQTGDKFDGPWILIRRRMLLDKALENFHHFFVSTVPLIQYDESLEDLSAIGVRNTDDTAFRYRWMLYTGRIQPPDPPRYSPK